MTSSKAGKKRKADIQKAQEIYEEKKRNKRLQAALTDTMRALPPTQENFQNFRLPPTHWYARLRSLESLKSSLIKRNAQWFKWIISAT